MALDGFLIITQKGSPRYFAGFVDDGLLSHCGFVGREVLVGALTDGKEDLIWRRKQEDAPELYRALLPAVMQPNLPLF